MVEKNAGKLPEGSNQHEASAPAGASAHTAETSSGPVHSAVETTDEAVVTTSSVLTNGAKLIGEGLLPGASLLLDGDFGGGAAHAVVGIGACMLLGPIAGLLVAADSFSQSVTKRSLVARVSTGLKDILPFKTGASPKETPAAAA